MFVHGAFPKIYPIVSVEPPQNVQAAIELARVLIHAGAGILQLRIKHLSDREFHEAAYALRAITRGKCRFIVNDRVDIAMAVNADGVHLGSDDFPVPAARHLLGDRAILGRSVDTAEEARKCARLPLDYVAWGAVFPSSTKSDAAPQPGPSQLREIKRAVGSRPLVAIGGISLENARTVLEAGADSVALISALRDHDDPGAALRSLG